MKNGKKALREFCIQCSISSSGSALGLALPMVPDVSVTVQSYKYPQKTLGEIFAIDPPYLLWLVRESKSSERVKKAAARILCGVPYVPPEVLFPYDASKRYNPALGWECIRKVLAEDFICPKINDVKR